MRFACGGANVSNAYTAYWDVDHRTGFECRGPDGFRPYGIISTRIIIDDRGRYRPSPARRGVSLKPDRERADFTANTGEGERQIGRTWRLLFIDGDWFRTRPVFEITIDRPRERCNFRSIGHRSSFDSDKNAKRYSFWQFEPFFIVD